MRPTDQLLARIAGEIEDRQTFIDGLVEDAEKAGRDLSEQEMELVVRARDRVDALGKQVEPLKDARRIGVESAQRLAEIHKYTAAQEGEKPRNPEYRSAGAYIMDRWRAGLGMEDAVNRLNLYHRAAAHQVTGDNPGLLPEPILGPVVNFVDSSRPLVTQLGPRQLPSGSWSRPKVTQHTSTGAQAGEKTELVSQKMLITKLPVSAQTIGGYVNVSRQNADWSQPQIMDIIVQDLAAQYAIDTEIETCGELSTAAPAGPTLGATPTSDEIAAAYWTAAAAIISATGGQGRIFSVTHPAMMGFLGPLFPPVNPQDAQSQGFTTSGLGTGLAGAVAGIPVYVSNGMATNTILVLSSAAAEVYEDRVGTLQVVEPSVLGIQVAFAGYFASLVLEANGLSKIVKPV